MRAQEDRYRPSFWTGTTRQVVVEKAKGGTHGRRTPPRYTGKESTMDRDDEQRYQRAHARVQALKGFYTHATVYVVVNIGLFVINLLTGGGWWFYWPLIGWGIGLGAHAIGVFGFSGGGPWGREWEERKTRELIDRDR